MKVAIIDMGTNTFHLLIAEVEGENYEILHRERRAVKIGEKGINKGEITKEAWERALVTLEEFKQIIEQQNIDQVFATATSAIRNATNGRALVEEIERRTGIKATIISGIKEAELILLGVRNALDLGNDKSLIMDIGGGSIEFIIANQAETFWLKSFEIGGQRLVEKFHKMDPITEEEIQSLTSYFDGELTDLLDAYKLHEPKTLIGCSGTFDTLSDIYCSISNATKEENATEYPLTLTAFHNIHEQLIEKTREERLAIPGMIEMRVDMIVVACVLINYLIKKLNLTSIRVSAYALKEGVLLDSITTVQKSISDN